MERGCFFLCCRCRTVDTYASSSERRARKGNMKDVRGRGIFFGQMTCQSVGCKPKVCGAGGV